MRSLRFTLIVAAAALSVILLDLPAVASAAEVTSTTSSSSSLKTGSTNGGGGALGSIRRALKAVQATGEGLEQVFPSLSEGAGAALYEASHLPAKLLGGATARGTRGGFAAPQMPTSEDATAQDAEARERDAARLLNDAVTWYQGSADDQDDAATQAPTTTAPAKDNALPEVDTLSRLHLRAAEASAEAKREARHFAAQQGKTQASEASKKVGASSVEHAYAFDIVGDEEDIAAAMQSRSEHRLVELLRWRREQRDHHQSPRIRPEYLPHYAKRFSGHPDAKFAGNGGKQSRGFRAQQAFTQPTYEYCHDGIAVIPSAVNFTCTTSSGGTQNLTAAEVAGEPPEVRANCTALQSRRACICPRDSIPGRTVFGDVVCFWREVKCQVERVSPTQCPEQPIDEPMRIQQCVTVPRSSTIGIAVNVTCEYSWADPRDYAFFGVDLLPIPADDAVDPATFLVLNTTNTSVNIKVNLTDSRFAAFGTYRQISDAVFIYTAEPATSIMPLTSVHPVVGGTSLFARPVNFNRLGDRRHQTSWEVGGTGYVVGQLTGQSLVTFTMNLGNVSSDFVHGNRMYIEGGIRGGISPVSVIAAPFTIDFSDLPVPPLRSASDNTLMIVLLATLIPLAVIVAVVVGICLWRRNEAKLRKERREDKED